MILNGSCNRGIGEERIISNGTAPCRFNGASEGTGYIGSGSCNDGNQLTCARNGSGQDNKGVILDDACNAPGACTLNRGVISKGCCNYPGACFSNTGTIEQGDDDCDGP